MLAQPGFLRTLANDAEAEVAESTFLEFLLHSGKQRDVLFHAQAPDKAENDGRVRWMAVATVGAEQLRVDAALHQVTAAPRSGLEQVAEIKIRRE